MRWNKDITPVLWLVVGIVLTLSGLRHVVTPEIYGRVRLPESAPLMEGWPVVLIGLTECAAGVLLILLLLRSRRH